MKTNGESARQWLASNQQATTEQRVRQIRDSLEKKANDLNNADQDVLDDEYQGIIEALEVIETFIHEKYVSGCVLTEERQTLDSSPLVADEPTDAPVLSQQEKKAAFQKLLKSSKF